MEAITPHHQKGKDMATHQRRHQTHGRKHAHPGTFSRQKHETHAPAHPRQRLRPANLPKKSLFDERQYELPERWDGYA